jgi:phage-related minor tail protein
MANDGFDLKTAELRGELEQLSSLADSFGQKLVTGLASAVTQGRKLSDVMRGIALSIANHALGQALKPVGNMLGNLFGNLVSGGVTPFADGGVVNSPMLFPLRGGTGLAGEAGPEAIMPLARGADGKLGVRGGGASRVTVNISTPDAESFKQSRSQVAALMSRALSKGQRNL